MKENESGMAQSSKHPVRPDEPDCQFYVKTGKCGFGESCCYNHPKEIPAEKIKMPKCRYLLTGYCKFGSECVYDHSMEKDVAGPMRQSQRRYETESSSRPEKRTKTIQQQRRESIEKKRRETRDNQQEETLKDVQENQNGQQNLEEERKRHIEKQRREARLRLEQVQQTVHFDEAIRVGETLADIGVKIIERNGFNQREVSGFLELKKLISFEKLS